MTVLNRDDPDWFWVLRHCDGNEGFVPSGFVYPGHVLHSYTTATTTATTATTNTPSTETHSPGGSLIVKLSINLGKILRSRKYMYMCIHKVTIRFEFSSVPFVINFILHNY